MAKKIYSIPLQKTQLFIKTNKSELKEPLKDTKKLELFKLLGKSYYILALEEFINFFKIYKDTKNALKTIEYFNSKIFIEQIATLLNFSQFNLEKEKLNIKDFFYTFAYLLHKKDKELFKHLFEKLFIHFSTSIHSNSNIKIDFKDMATFMAKNNKIEFQESFGENNKEAYFKILINHKPLIEEKGKIIKTLRKKAYKRFFFYLVENSKQNPKSDDIFEL